VISLSPRATAHSLLFPGESLFVELPERFRDSLPAQLRIHADRGELFSTIGALSSRSEETVQGPEHAELWVASNEALLRSLLWLSDDALQLESQSTHAQLDVVVEASFAPLSAVFSEQLAAIVDQLDRWVGHDPVPWRGLLLLDASWDRGAHEGFARGSSAILQLGPESAQDEQELTVLLAHELFHAYNGGQLRFAPDEYLKTQWFREGATSYVALLAAVHSGLLSEQRFLSMLAKHADGANAAPEHMELAAYDLRRTRSAYDRGVILCMAIDLVLRDLSDNQRSFRAFWQYLSRSSRWQMEQSNQSLREALSDYAGMDFSPFFRDYVLAQTPLPIAALMRNAGLGVSMVEQVRGELGLELRYDVQRAALVVQQATGAAKRAQLRSGDRLIPTRNTHFDNGLEPVEFEVERSGELLFLRVFPKKTVDLGYRLEWLADENEPPAALRKILDDR
jgi:predicted metalloprotease with PDZ domain